MAESAKDDNPLVFYLDCQLEMNSSADKLYDIFRNECELFPRLMPEVIKNVEKIGPDVWLWTFVDADKNGTWKNRVEGNKEKITWTLLEAPVLETFYETVTVDYQFFQTCNGCKAKLKVIYEMKNVNVQTPHFYMGFICGLLVAADNNPPKH